MRTHANRRPAVDRFWANIYPDPNTGCWLWGGRPRTERCPYGTLKVDGRDVRAHRFSYELHNGPIPGGLWVLHRCDVMACVNPDHLYLGTTTENSRDLVQRNRLTRAKLSIEDVRAIVVSGDGPSILARRYGVSIGAIRRLRSGRSWSVITGKSTRSPWEGPSRKLTSAQALEIFTSPDSEKTLAKRYGVGATTIHRIKAGERYAHVTRALRHPATDPSAAPDRRVPKENQR